MCSLASKLTKPLWKILGPAWSGACLPGRSGYKQTWKDMTKEGMQVAIDQLDVPESVIIKIL